MAPRRLVAVLRFYDMISDSRVIVSHVFICRDERELLAALTCLE